jgi:signal transduction histidine kinase
MADTIEIAFERDAGCFVLEVRDNGKGFDTQSRRNPNTFGLAGMRERVMAVGGDLTVESGAGRGTTVCARIPVGSATDGTL